MSRFSGKQGKGASRRAKEIRMYQAYNRQRVCWESGRTAHGWRLWTCQDPEEFLSQQAREALAAGHLDVASWGLRP